jgi:hypothetical protein
MAQVACTKYRPTQDTDSSGHLPYISAWLQFLLPVGIVCFYYSFAEGHFAEAVLFWVTCYR